MQWVGPAFQGITDLELWSLGSNISHLSTSLFAGLTACDQLRSLAVVKMNGRQPQWELGSELSSHPEQLRQWLPHVTHLTCSADSGLLPLVRGLGPQLTALNLSKSKPNLNDNQYGVSSYSIYSSGGAQFAEALTTGCSQLQHISLHLIDQQLLDACVQLPALTHIETVKGMQHPELYQPRHTSQSVWRELQLGGEANDLYGHCMDVYDLAMFPLATTQKLVVHKGQGELATSTPLLAPTAARTAEAHAEQQQSIAAVAGVPELLWSGAFKVKVWDMRCMLLGDWDTAAGVPRDPLQRLHQIITDCAPLAARGCHSLSLSLPMSFDPTLRIVMSRDTVAAIGTVFGDTLACLQLDAGISSFSPSFWPALTGPHLPNLHSVDIAGWYPTHPTLEGDSLPALAGMAADYSGQPLTITFKLSGQADAAAVSAALGLPMPVRKPYTLELRLPRS